MRKFITTVVFALYATVLNAQIYLPEGSRPDNSDFYWTLEPDHIWINLLEASVHDWIEVKLATNTISQRHYQSAVGVQKTNTDNPFAASRDRIAGWDEVRRETIDRYRLSNGREPTLKDVGLYFDWVPTKIKFGVHADNSGNVTSASMSFCSSIGLFHATPQGGTTPLFALGATDKVSSQHRLYMGLTKDDLCFALDDMKGRFYQKAQPGNRFSGRFKVGISNLAFAEELFLRFDGFKGNDWEVTGACRGSVISELTFTEVVCGGGDVFVVRKGNTPIFRTGYSNETRSYYLNFFN